MLLGLAGEERLCLQLDIGVDTVEHKIRSLFGIHLCKIRRQPIEILVDKTHAPEPDRRSHVAAVRDIVVPSLDIRVVEEIVVVVFGFSFRFVNLGRIVCGHASKKGLA